MQTQGPRTSAALGAERDQRAEPMPPPDLPPAFVYRVRDVEGVALYRDLAAVRRHVQQRPDARVEIVWHRA